MKTGKNLVKNKINLKLLILLMGQNKWKPKKLKLSVLVGETRMTEPREFGIICHVECMSIA